MALPPSVTITSRTPAATAQASSWPSPNELARDPHRRYDPLTDGTRSDALAANVDIAPTIAALAGALAPGAQGRSLLPILEDTAAAVHEEILIEHVEYRSDHGRPDPPTYCAVRTPNRLFVHYASGEEELYDLDRDPWQLRNLARVPPRREELTALRRRTMQLCRPKPPGFTWG